MEKIMRRTGIVLTAAFLIGGGWTVAIGGNNLQMPAEPITIEGKKPAVFDHQGHMALGLTCGSCHHDSRHQPLRGEDIAALPGPEQLECASCHNENFAEAKLQKKMDVFHARCKECHQEGVDGKKGPTKCSGCHVKKPRKAAIEGC